MKNFAFYWSLMLIWGGCAAETTEHPWIAPETEQATSFNQFHEDVPCRMEPSMNRMGLPVEPERVINLHGVLLRAGVSGVPDILLQNGFFVSPMDYPTDDPVAAFQRIEDADVPVFVSSGIPLHLLHIFFDQILQQVETDHLCEDLLAVCTALYESSLQREDLTAAAYFAVPLTFLDQSFQPASAIESTVTEEVELMKAHAGFAESPVFGYEEDYSQYVPRGHYTASQELSNYFMAMMYMGRLTFLLKGGSPHGPMENYLVSEETANELTLSALEITRDLNTLEANGESLLLRWKRIYGITAFFVGFADDMSVMEYSAAAVSAGGDIHSGSFMNGFLMYITENFTGPSIYSGTGASVVMPDENGNFDPSEYRELLSKTAGFRLFGQRYVPDSEILGKFVFPSIGRNSAGEERFMPSGLDVAAAFRCPAALEIVNSNGFMDHSFYSDTLVAMQDMIDGFTEEDWHSTLYMCWLHSLKLLVEERGAGYPDFMGTEDWNRCTLSTFLASWAMLRHDTILYVKQSYTPLAGCAPNMGEPVPSAGFVEPLPGVYAELRGTLLMVRNGLSFYGILDGETERKLENAQDLLATLQDIAERELAGEMLTEEDADFLKGFAGYLESTITLGERTTEGLETSLVADVHTDQNSGNVIEVASGYLDNCIVIYERADGVVEAAMGPVLSYHEFTWPMNDRLTDEAWRDILRNDPSRPEWTSSYLNVDNLSN